MVPDRVPYNKEVDALSTYSGVVRKIFTNQFGGKKLYSFSMDSDKSYFNLGEKTPSFSEGNTVSFDGAPGKRVGNVDVKSPVTVVGEQAVNTESYQMGGAKRSVEVMTKDQYWSNREANDVKVQKVIQVQAARNAAIATMSVIFDPSKETAEEYINRWTDIFLKNNEDRLA